MKHLLAVAAVVLFFCSGILALFWFGHCFSLYTAPEHNLSIEKPVAQLLPLGSQTVLDLHGAGFNQKTSVSLFMDVNNSEAVIGSLPLEGIYNESLILGEYLYLARDEGGLQVLSIKNPQQPRLLKEYLVGRTVVDIHHNGSHFFLSCGKLGVAMMKISQDGLLEHVTDIVSATTANQSLFVDGFLYVAAGSGRLLIYDIRQPDQIELVEIVNPGLFSSKMTTFGDQLYLLTAGKRIEIYQLTEPQMPLLVGSLKFTETLYDLLVHQGQLYVATASGVSLYNLSNTSQPELSKRWTNLGSAKKIFAGMESVYVSDSYSGLRIINSDVESSPGYFNLNIDPRTITESADYLFVAGSHKGLLVVDRKALLSRQVVKSLNTPGSAHDLFIKDHWLYIADTRGGVMLHDLHAEDATVSTITSRRGEFFAAQRELLFVAEGKMGVEIFDISDPGLPEPVALWPEIYALRLAVDDDYLLSAKGVFGVELIDISNIQQPTVRDVLSDVHALDIISENHLIYIASKNKGLMIYEITENLKFNHLSSLKTPFPMNSFDLTMSVQVKDGIAYIANGRSGLLIVDVKKPTKPVILSSVDIPGQCKKVRVVGERVFVTSHKGGVNVVNVADPKDPILLNSISMPGLSRGLQIVDDLIYAAHNEMGVTVFPVPVMAAKVDLISEQQMRVTLPSPKFSGRYSLQINNCQDMVVHDGVVTYQ